MVVMAHKSKSQKRRAHARRINKKNSVLQTEIQENMKQVETKISQEVKKEEKKVKKEKSSAINYFRAVKGELARTTFPNNQEVKAASGVVLASLVFFGLLFYAVDSGIVPALFAYTSI